jgi:proteasome lid subunit RPN8/RPN11
MSLRLPKECKTIIRNHAESTFPEECCGAMLGRDREDGPREVHQVLTVENTKGGDRGRRFLIDPRALLAAEKKAAELKLDVVGIYHSHPDHPSQASEFDREHAMPFWSYVIVSCIGGRSGSLQSWRLREDRSRFDEETVE